MKKEEDDEEEELEEEKWEEEEERGGGGVINAPIFFQILRPVLVSPFKIHFLKKSFQMFLKLFFIVTCGSNSHLASCLLMPPPQCVLCYG